MRADSLLFDRLGLRGRMPDELLTRKPRPPEICVKGAVLRVVDWQEVIYTLSSCAIFNDLE